MDGATDYKGPIDFRPVYEEVWGVYDGRRRLNELRRPHLPRAAAPTRFVACPSATARWWPSTRSPSMWPRRERTSALVGPTAAGRVDLIKVVAGVERAEPGGSIS